MKNTRILGDNAHHQRTNGPRSYEYNFELWVSRDFNSDEYHTLNQLGGELAAESAHGKLLTALMATEGLHFTEPAREGLYPEAGLVGCENPGLVSVRLFHEQGNTIGLTTSRRGLRAVSVPTGTVYVAKFCLTEPMPSSDFCKVYEGFSKALKSVQGLINMALDFDEARLYSFSLVGSDASYHSFKDRLRRFANKHGIKEGRSILSRSYDFGPNGREVKFSLADGLGPHEPILLYARNDSDVLEVRGALERLFNVDLKLTDSF